MDELENCSLCGRELVDGPSIDRHHLIPKTYGGKEIETIHRVCHGKIHHVFDEKQLRDHYHTWDRLLEHEEIQKFVSWVRKKEPEYYTHHKDTHERKRKR